MITAEIYSFLLMDCLISNNQLTPSNATLVKTNSMPKGVKILKTILGYAELDRITIKNNIIPIKPV